MVPDRGDVWEGLVRPGVQHRMQRQRLLRHDGHPMVHCAGQGPPGGTGACPHVAPPPAPTVLLGPAPPLLAFVALPVAAPPLPAPTPLPLMLLLPAAPLPTYPHARYAAHGSSWAWVSTLSS